MLAPTRKRLAELRMGARSKGLLGHLPSGREAYQRLPIALDDEGLVGRFGEFRPLPYKEIRWNRSCESSYRRSVPVYCWPRLVAKAGPIGGNGSESDASLS